MYPRVSIQIIYFCLMMIGYNFSISRRNNLAKSFGGNVSLWLCVEHDTAWYKALPLGKDSTF